MAKSRILIVADDASLRATLARWLLGAGYAVELAESARRAYEVMANESLNLAVVGAADPEFARELTERIKRVILISQPGQEGEVASEPSVQPGGSLAWPCSEQDLLTRVRTELESAPAAQVQQVPGGPQLFRFEGYTLDAEARSLLDAKGQDVTLTRAEFSLLLAFARQPGRVLSRDELTQVVAGRGAEPDDRSVDVLISRLRRKIEPDPKAPRLIVTMPSEGYKFTAKPQAVTADPATAAPSSAATSPAAAQDALGGGSSARPAEGRKTAGEKSRTPRALIAAAAVVLIAVLGWAAWSYRPASQQAEATPSQTTSQPGNSAQRRASAFKRMVAAMQDDRFAWRTIERLAVEAGIDEAEAREILAEHLDQVVLGKSHDGKLIARLSTR